MEAYMVPLKYMWDDPNELFNYMKFLEHQYPDRKSQNMYYYVHFITDCGADSLDKKYTPPKFIELIRNQVDMLTKQNFVIFLKGLNKSEALIKFESDWMFDKNVLYLIREFLVYDDFI